jgi:hypothetical protein
MLGASVAFVLLALATMAALHERHYRSRVDRVDEARARARSLGLVEGALIRLSTLEDIVCEDRAT